MCRCYLNCGAFLSYEIIPKRPKRGRPNPTLHMGHLPYSYLFLDYAQAQSRTDVRRCLALLQERFKRVFLKFLAHAMPGIRAHNAIRRRAVVRHNLVAIDRYVAVGAIAIFNLLMHYIVDRVSP